MISKLTIYLVVCLILHATELLKERKSQYINNKQNIINDTARANTITYARIMLWPFILCVLLCCIPIVLYAIIEVFIDESFPIDLSKESPT
jgi:hypothetical protein